MRSYPNLPIVITENGVNDSGDELRRRYLAQHIHQMWRAVNFNWPVKGYFYWTLVDNFEWERGWTHQFGLWGLDVETQKRIKRPSAGSNAEICRENGLSSDMVQSIARGIWQVISCLRYARAMAQTFSPLAVVCRPCLDPISGEIGILQNDLGWS